MNGRAVLAACIAATGVTFQACGKLPETYGVYLDEGEFVRLAEASTIAEPFAVADPRRIVIIDNRLRHPAELSEVVQLRRAGYVRSTVEVVVHRKGLPPVSRRLRATDEWDAKALGQPVAVDHSPVRGRDDALVVTPREPLAPGVYDLLVFDDHYPFAAPADGVDESKKECRDQWLTVLAKNAYFSWDNWRPSVENPRTRKGEPILASEFTECARADAMTDLKTIGDFHVTQDAPNRAQIEVRWKYDVPAGKSLMLGVIPLAEGKLHDSMGFAPATITGASGTATLRVYFGPTRSPLAPAETDALWFALYESPEKQPFLGSSPEHLALFERIVEFPIRWEDVQR